MRVAVLSAREGWHTRELCRALGDRGHEGDVLPYDGLIARPGTAPGAEQRLSAGREALLHAAAVLARFIPNGSLEQII